MSDKSCTVKAYIFAATLLYLYLRLMRQEWFPPPRYWLLKKAIMAER